MKLNRIELKKIIYDFNSISNRLMQADFNDYNGVLSKFLNYINTTAVISDYVKDCGICIQNLDEEFREVANSYGNSIFTLGDTDDEEVCNVYAILKYSLQGTTRRPRNGLLTTNGAMLPARGIAPVCCGGIQRGQRPIWHTTLRSKV